MTPQTARALGLPLPSNTVIAVLLADESRPSQLEQHFRAAQWPTGIETLIPEAGSRDAIAAWFGILRFPCVAVVMDGMLLGLEHACTEEACARLAALAQAGVAPRFDV